MNKIAINQDLVFKPLHVKITLLFRQGFTYNIFKNMFALTGLLYGLAIGISGYFIISEIMPDFVIDEPGYLTNTLKYFLFFQPLLGFLFLGAIGSLIKIRREYFLESYYALMEIADTDSLTGLYNNRFFKIRAQELFHLAKRYDNEFCIIMFDIDDFKKVNDTYGHPEGDHILYMVAMILKKHSRSSDIPVRYGGEEFLLFLDRTSPKIGSIIANRIRKAIDEEVIVLSGKKPMNVTVSGGLSSFPVDEQQIEDLVKIADVRLYKAKELGKNRVVNRQGEIN